MYAYETSIVPFMSLQKTLVGVASLQQYRRVEFPILSQSNEVNKKFPVQVGVGVLPFFWRDTSNIHE